MSQFNHPELEQGEMFLSNVNVNTSCMMSIPFTTARLGRVAYFSNGVPIPNSLGYRPVFIAESEHPNYAKY
jgi:hypothetical protein